MVAKYYKYKRSFFMLFRTTPTEAKIEVNVKDFLKSLTEESIKTCTDVAFLAEVLIEKLKVITEPVFAQLRWQKKISLNPYRAPELEKIVANIDQRMQSATAKYDNSINALNEIKKKSSLQQNKLKLSIYTKKNFLDVLPVYLTTY